MTDYEIAFGTEKVFEQPKWLKTDWKSLQRQDNKPEQDSASRDSAAPISAEEAAKARTKFLLDADMIGPFDRNKDNELSKKEIADALKEPHSIEQKAGLKMLADNFDDIAGIAGRSKYLQVETISRSDIKLVARAAFNRIDMAADPERARQLQLEDLKSRVLPSQSETLVKAVVLTAVGAGVGYLYGGWRFAIGNGLVASTFALGTSHIEDRMAINRRTNNLDNRILPNWSKRIGNLTAQDFPERI